MKKLHAIVTLCIASSCFLTAISCEKSLFISYEKPFIGIQTYWPQREFFNPNTREPFYSHGRTYSYCLSWLHKSDSNCPIINAYILLNRRPQESVEEQLIFYKNDLETTTKQIDSMPNKFNLDPESDVFRKNKLRQRQTLLQNIIPQIEQANLSGKVQDSNIKEQIGNALNNIKAYNQQELKELTLAVEKAHQCDLLDKYK
jgi:hypothetical protein